MTEAIFVRPAFVHRLTEAADAPHPLAALRPVHGRTFLGLADVRTLIMAAPEVGARIIELEASTKFETFPEFHFALVV